MIRRIAALSLVLSLALAASGTSSAERSSPAGARRAAASTLPAPATGFGSFTLVPLLASDTPPYRGPATPKSLKNVKVAPEVRHALARPGVTATLLKQGFVIVPSDLRLFHFAYDGNVYDGWPVFVTTDVAYHEWHLAFDKLVRSLEQQVLLPKLDRLVAGLLARAHAQTVAAAGTPLAGPASRVEQLYQVAAAELGLSTPLGPLARREKALIDAHSATGALSPLLGSKVDYSVYVPRGHYTRNAALTRYFLGMSVLGQAAFCLPGTKSCQGLLPARVGILASRVLTGSQQLLALYRQIYEPTAFLVGVADDYTPVEVAAAVEKAVPAAAANPAVLARDRAVLDVVAALKAARPVRINPERAAIRVMGTRFVIDSYVLDQLVYPNVGTRDNPRLVPSALDLAAVFGSDFAFRLQQRSGQTAYLHYTSQLDALRDAVARRPARDWGGTVYDAWLSALQPEFVAKGTAYPSFMRGTAWQAESQQSALGSYAELRHDTILYTKQVVAEGGDNLPVPARRNWVEPDPVVFARLAAVTDLLHSGLQARHLLTGESGQLLTRETGLFRFLARIARDELAGKPITVKDNERLTYIGGELESLFWLTADRTAAGAAQADQDAAVVADIASSPQGVLELGTGRVDRIYVLVPDDRGRFQVAAGGVYSYYEFTNPPGQRLTDAAWRQRLASGKAPKRPTWEQVTRTG